MNIPFAIMSAVIMWILSLFAVNITGDTPEDAGGSGPAGSAGDETKAAKPMRAAKPPKITKGPTNKSARRKGAAIGMRANPYVSAVAKAAPTKSVPADARPTLIHWDTTDVGNVNLRRGNYYDPTLLMEPMYSETRYHAEYAGLIPKAFASEIVDSIDNSGSLRSQLLAEMGIANDPQYTNALNLMTNYGIMIELAVSVLTTFYSAKGVADYLSGQGVSNQSLTRLQAMFSKDSLEAAALLSEHLSSIVYYTHVVQHAQRTHSSIAIQHSTFMTGERATVWFRPHPILLQINNRRNKTSVRPSNDWTDLFSTLRSRLKLDYKDLTSVLRTAHSNGNLPQSMGVLTPVKGAQVAQISSVHANHELYHGHINMPAYVPYEFTGSAWRALPRWVEECDSKLFYYTPKGDAPGPNWTLCGYTYVAGHYSSRGPLGVVAMPLAQHGNDVNQPFASIWVFDYTGLAVECGEAENGDEPTHDRVQIRGSRSTFLKLGGVTTNAAGDLALKPGKRICDVISTGASALLDVFEYNLTREEHREMLITHLFWAYGANPSYNWRVAASVNQQPPWGAFELPGIDLINGAMDQEGYSGWVSNMGYPTVIAGWNDVTQAP